MHVNILLTMHVNEEQVRVRHLAEGCLQEDIGKQTHNLLLVNDDLVS